MKEISANTKRNERYNIDFQKIEKTCNRYVDVVFNGNVRTSLLWYEYLQ